jgi:hypothetical protein
MTLSEHEPKPSTRSDFSVIEDRWEVVCKGAFERGDILALIDTFSDNIALRPEVKKGLIDISGATIALGIMGEYVIGEHAARKLSGLRVALVQASGQINKLMEDTAYNRGLRIQLVADRVAALEWLDR